MDCLRRGQMFEDPDFPASDASLYYSCNPPYRFEWKRPGVCFLDDMSRLVTKPTKWHVRPVKTQISLGIHPVWSSLRCLHEESLGPELPIECTAKTLIRLGGCPGWSESSLGAHVSMLVLSRGGSCDDSHLLVYAVWVLKVSLTVSHLVNYVLRLPFTIRIWATSRESLSSGFPTR